MAKRCDPPDFHGQTVLFRRSAPASLSRPDCLQMSRNISLPVLEDGGQGRGRANPISPIGTADETVLSCQHHVTFSDDCRHGKTVADRLGENCNIRLEPEVQVGASRIQTESSRDLVYHQDCPKPCGNFSDSFQKARRGSRFLIGSITMAANSFLCWQAIDSSSSK